MFNLKFKAISNVLSQHYESTINNDCHLNLQNPLSNQLEKEIL